MKLRLVYTLFLSLLALAVLPANKNGRATEAKVGNTGAPGDEALPNGIPLTCISCHTASPITASMGVHIIDADGDTITQYVPGTDYTARVEVTAVTGDPKGYGFQMIALKDDGEVDLDGFTDPGNNTVNNYKLATIPNGRTYAEHDNVSNSNIFDVKWTAPPAGTGDITFYAAGNAVNKNGLNSGDGASFTSLQMAEDLGASAQNPAAEQIGLQIWPNPAHERLNLSFNAPRSGDYRIIVRNLSGRVVWESVQTLATGVQQPEIQAIEWASGVYFMSVSGAGIEANIKFLKL